MTAAAKKDARGVGFVVPSFTQGSIVLKDSDGRHVRLSWENGPSKKKGAKKGKKRLVQQPGKREHQFLNVGWGVHPETILGLFNEKGIAHSVSKY